VIDQFKCGREGFKSAFKIVSNFKLQNIMLKVVFPQDATNELCSKPPLVSKTNPRKHFEPVYDEASSMKIGFVDRKPWHILKVFFRVE
jgi:hypothetical protein